MVTIRKNKFSIKFVKICTVVALLGATTVFFADNVTKNLVKKLDSEEKLVRDQYPGAQVWFDYVAAKYPAAQLGSVLFCISDTYRSKTGKICFPENIVIQLDKCFSGKKNIAHDSCLPSFAIQEWLILHEACHVLSGDVASIDQALIASAIATITGAFLGPLGFCAAAGTSVAGVQALSHKHEYRADAFANAHAEKPALLAAIVFFKSLQNNSYDFAHPDPSIRLKNVQEALKQRFNC